ncbi:hypothetical protein QL285_095170 [Trifolium repens]|nr:hypothetical protein QL285_095170 [Trifolium repens]
MEYPCFIAREPTKTGTKNRRNRTHIEDESNTLKTKTDVFELRSRDEPNTLEYSPFGLKKNQTLAERRTKQNTTKKQYAQYNKQRSKTNKETDKQTETLAKSKTSGAVVTLKRACREPKDPQRTTQKRHCRPENRPEPPPPT